MNNSFERNASASIAELLESWQKTGTDIGKFYEILGDMDERTEFIKVRLNTIDLLSLISLGTLQAKTGITTFEAGKWPVLQINKETCYDVFKCKKIDKNLVVCEGTDSEAAQLKKEIDRVGVLITANCDSSNPDRNVVVPLSRWAFRDLCERTGVCCTSIESRSINRDRWIAENLNDNKTTFIVRKSINGGQKKVVSIRGQVYEGVKQLPCIQYVMDALQKELGSAEGISWSVSNDLVEIIVKFEDKQKEIAAAYPSLPDDIIPVVKIVTSDVGLSAFKIIPGFMHKNSLILSNKGVSLMHDKTFEGKKIINEVNKKVYPEFIAIPENMARLLGIKITDMDDAIEELFDFIKLGSKEGLKKVNKELKNALKMEMSFGSYTAYDLVTRLFTIPNDITIKKSDGSDYDFSESGKAKLDECIANAIFCPFKDQGATAYIN